jgi:hypothetical protein
MRRAGLSLIISRMSRSEIPLSSRSRQFRAGGDGFLAGGGERLGERLDLPLGFRGPGGRRRSQCLCPQPGRLGLGELRQDLSRVDGGGLLQRRADKHRRLADERVKRHERVLGPRR